MTDTTHIRHEQPIEPTTVELSGERTDRATPPPPPPPTAPPAPPPRRRTPPTPPPAGPPAGPPARPPANPPAPRNGGGVMAPPAPAPAPVHHHHYYPAPPAQQDRPPRFSISRLSPVRNGSALVLGLVFVPDTGKLLHALGDESGVMMAALAATGILELIAHRYGWRIRAWLVRALTFNLLASSVVTASGLYMYGSILTGVWS
ncbi:MULTISPECIES: hypothetical protein [unclassified Streptomyces]|uniref:hypothetical protein n=1 Tax=unclassified Streptomyces TaxID=2593676 RepID=UPI00368A0A4F